MALSAIRRSVRRMARDGSPLLETAVQFAATIGGRACYLVLQVFLARSLGPLGFGLYAIGWTVAGLASTLSPIGMPQATQRFAIGGRRSLRGAPIIASTLVGLATMAALIATSDTVATAVFSEPRAAGVIAAFAPSVPLLGLLLVLAAALRSSNGILVSAGVWALVFPFNLAATLLAFHFNASPAMAAHMYTLSLFVALLPAVWVLYGRPSGNAGPGLTQLIRFGLLSMTIGGANILNLWADRVVIGVMADVRAVGLYQVASQLAMVAIVLRSTVLTIFEARVPKTAAHPGQVPDVTREFLAGTRLLVHISAPGLMALALTAGFWTTALFGNDYAAAGLPLAVLAMGQVLTTFLGPSASALHMTGEERATMNLTLVSCVVNLGGNVALLPVLGLAGAAAASVAANLLVGFVCLRRLRATGRLRLPEGALTDMVVAITAATLVGGLLAAVLGPGSLAAGLAVPAAAYAVYAIVVVWGCRVEDEAVALARTLLRRLPGLALERS